MTIGQKIDRFNAKVSYAFYRLCVHIFPAEKVCNWFGHDLADNAWGSQPPTEGICRCCHRKWKFDYSGDIIHDGPKWIEVDAFTKGDGTNYTDEELIKIWK